MEWSPIERLTLQALAYRARRTESLAVELGVEPALLAEVLRRLQEDGALRQVAGKWVVAPGAFAQGPSETADDPDTSPTLDLVGRMDVAAMATPVPVTGRQEVPRVTGGRVAAAAMVGVLAAGVILAAC